jgi:hypothetical protein
MRQKFVVTEEQKMTPNMFHDLQGADIEIQGHHPELEKLKNVFIKCDDTTISYPEGTVRDEHLNRCHNTIVDDAVSTRTYYGNDHETTRLNDDFLQNDPKKCAAAILDVAGMDSVQECTKLPTLTLINSEGYHDHAENQGKHAVFPGVNNPDGTMTIPTKEGVITYDETRTQVTQIINGELWNDRGMTDTYAWDEAKAAKQLGKASTLSIEDVERQVSDPEMQKAIKNVMDSVNIPSLVTEAEKRLCIVVTPELADAGVTKVINEWEGPNAQGICQSCDVKVGDALIVNFQKDGSVSMYRIEEEAFKGTHSLDGADKDKSVAADLDNNKSAKDDGVGVDD